MDATAIRSIALNIREAVATRDPAELRVEYNEFAERFPKLFDVCCNPDFKLDHLDMMLNTMKGLLDQKLDGDAANEFVFCKLKAQYVDHIEELLVKEQESKK